MFVKVLITKRDSKIVPMRGRLFTVYGLFQVPQRTIVHALFGLQWLIDA